MKFISNGRLSRIDLLTDEESLMKMKVLTVVAIALCGAIADTSANAADMNYSEPVSGWTYKVSPYGWAAGMKGDVGMFGAPVASVDIKFVDVFDAIDWGNFPAVAFINAEARREEFGVFGDLVHLALAADATGPRGRINIDLSLQATIASALATYRVVEEEGSYLDLMAGVRYWNVDAKLNLSGQAAAAGFSDGGSWVDPMIGVKGQYDINDTYFLEGWAMYGGFGVAADMDWDVYGALGYRANDKWTLQAGWRHLEIDYTKNSFVFDLAMSGPMFQATYRF